MILQILRQILFFLQRAFESTERPGIPYTTHYLPKRPSASQLIDQRAIGQSQ